MSLFQSIIDTPFAQLGVKVQNNAVISIDFLPVNSKKPFVNSDFTQCIANHINRYLSNPEFLFDIPLSPAGSEFQRSVWNIMQTIRAGKTLTYGDVAKILNSSPRAVGNACRRNPIPLLIPCHRIVAKNGIGGFAGQTDGDLLKIKRWLLAHEAG